MKKNLGEWTAEVRNYVKELERKIKGVQNMEEDEFAKLKLNLKNFYHLFTRKTDIRFKESYDQNEQKWNRLAQQYAIKFRENEIYFGADMLASKGNLAKIARMIGGFGADLNTFLAQIDLFSLEQRFELYKERVEKLYRNEELAEIMQNLEEFVENEEIDPKMVDELKNTHEQNQMKYRQSLGEFLGKIVIKIRKIQKEIAENHGEIYLTERPFENAENRFNELKNDHRTTIEMSNLRRILDQLLLEARLEILRNEFNAKFESVNKNIFEQQFHHGDALEWRPFMALADAFDFDWKEIDRKSRDLSSKDQRDLSADDQIEMSAEDQRGMREQLEQIKEAAQIKAKPFKAMFIDRLKGIAEARADFDLIKADIHEARDHSHSDISQFWDRAIELCAKLYQIDQRISIILNRHISPKEIGAEMREFKRESTLLPWSLKGSVRDKFDANLSKIEEIIKRIEGMKTMHLVEFRKRKMKTSSETNERFVYWLDDDYFCDARSLKKPPKMRQ